MELAVERPFIWHLGVRVMTRGGGSTANERQEGMKPIRFAWWAVLIALLFIALAIAFLQPNLAY